MPQNVGLLFVVLLIGLVLMCGPCRNPVPDDPPVPPTPVSGLAARVRQLVQDLVPVSARGKAPALAAEYRRLAAEIDASRDPLSETTLATPAAAIAASNAAARQVLGVQWAAWAPFYSALYAELNSAAARPDADRTVYGVGRTFTEIAAGLAAP